MAPGERRVARVEATSRFSKLSSRVVPWIVGAEKAVDAKRTRLVKNELTSMLPEFGCRIRGLLVYKRWRDSQKHKRVQYNTEFNEKNDRLNRRTSDERGQDQCSPERTNIVKVYILTRQATP